VNPSLTIVSTSDTASDITMAMIAGTSSGAYLGVNTPGRSLGFSLMGPAHEFRCLRLAMPVDFRGLAHLPGSFSWRMRRRIAAFLASPYDNPAAAKMAMPLPPSPGAI